MGDQGPYEKLLVEEKGDLKSYRPKLVSLARGMALGDLHGEGDDFGGGLPVGIAGGLDGDSDLV